MRMEYLCPPIDEMRVPFDALIVRAYCEILGYSLPERTLRNRYILERWYSRQASNVNVESIIRQIEHPVQVKLSQSCAINVVIRKYLDPKPS